MEENHGFKVLPRTWKEDSSRNVILNLAGLSQALIHKIVSNFNAHKVQIRVQSLLNSGFVGLYNSSNVFNFHELINSLPLHISYSINAESDKCVKLIHYYSRCSSNDLWR